jgi:hypothetical protein
MKKIMLEKLLIKVLRLPIEDICPYFNRCTYQESQNRLVQETRCNGKYYTLCPVYINRKKAT